METKKQFIEVEELGEKLFKMAVSSLNDYILKIKYPEPDSVDILNKFIKAYNVLATNEDDSKIGDVMDNQSLIEVMSKHEMFNARVISELYRSISQDKTSYFLYNNNLIINDIELIDVSSIGEIKNTIINSLGKIVAQSLRTPENPIFTPIYKIIFRYVIKI